MPYTKDWTLKYNDEFYQKLKLSGRSIWDQLRSYIKLNGDSGKIFLRNFRVLSEFMGSDLCTCKKFLRFFHSKGKLTLVENDDGSVFIELHKYLYYQRLKDDNEHKKDSKKTDGKPPVFHTQLEKNRIEKNRLDYCGNEKVNQDSSDSVNPKLEEWQKLEAAWDSMVEAGDMQYFAQKQSINPDDEILKMINWIKANPDRAKKNYKRFINNWLTRAIDKAEDKGGQYAKGSS